MLIRLIFLLLGIYFALKFLGRLLLPRRADGGGQGNDKSGEELVACSACGTYLQKERGTTRGGKFFCNEQCASTRRHGSG